MNPSITIDQLILSGHTTYVHEEDTDTILEALMRGLNVECGLPIWTEYDEVITPAEDDGGPACEPYSYGNGDGSGDGWSWEGSTLAIEAAEFEHAASQTLAKNLLTQVRIYEVEQ